jgi:serine/threonine-protein kinase
VPLTTPVTIGGRYRVVRELGRGGMGVVYRVEHLHTGEALALKVLLAHAGANPEIVERFRREMRAPARIGSENVVRITDADVAPELDGAPYLVMELLDGGDLEELAAQRGPLPAEDVLWLLAQAGRALDQAHAAGIVHRDLKPQNLFLHRRADGSQLVKLLDFGIAKVAEAAELTQSGAVIGTPLYMAPEQAFGRTAAIGPATDVWALGMIAHRLLAGAPYIAAASMAEIFHLITLAPMPPPSRRAPALPTAFDAWFARSCDRDPARRFRDHAEQVRALAAALGVGPPLELRAAPARGRGAWSVVLATGAVAAAVAALLAVRARPAAPDAAPPVPVIEVLATGADAGAPAAPPDAGPHAAPPATAPAPPPVRSHPPRRAPAGRYDPAAP